jgi:hypothetical protein
LKEEEAKAARHRIRKVQERGSGREIREIESGTVSGRGRASGREESGSESETVSCRESKWERKKKKKKKKKK